MVQDRERRLTPLAAAGRDLGGFWAPACLRCAAMHRIVLVGGGAARRVGRAPAIADKPQWTVRPPHNLRRSLASAIAWSKELGLSCLVVPGAAEQPPCAVDRFDRDHTEEAKGCDEESPSSGRPPRFGSTMKNSTVPTRLGRRRHHRLTVATPPARAEPADALVSPRTTTKSEPE
jgi:hypothetical protein